MALGVRFNNNTSYMNLEENSRITEDDTVQLGVAQLEGSSSRQEYIFKQGHNSFLNQSTVSGFELPYKT